MSPESLDLQQDKFNVMYHIIYDLESRFYSWDEVVRYVERTRTLVPRRPHTAMVGENTSVPRISLAPSIVDCFNGINVKHRFRRCLSGDIEGVKDYKNENEVYPVIVCMTRDLESVVTPTSVQVEDARWTHERWGLVPVMLVSIHIAWLGHDSVKVSTHSELDRMWCTQVDFVSDLQGKVHPWLNGKGHPLDCSDPGTMPWPRRDLAQQHLWYESFVGQTVVYVVPEVPYTGYATCMPVDGSDSYRARLHDCFRFTGCYDQNREPIFDGDWIHCNDHIGGGSVDMSDISCPKVRLDNSDNTIWFQALDFMQVRSLEYRYIREKSWFKDIFM